MYLSNTTIRLSLVGRHIFKKNRKRCEKFPYRGGAVSCPSTQKTRDTGYSNVCRGRGVGQVGIFHTFFPFFFKDCLPYHRCYHCPHLGNHHDQKHHHHHHYNHELICIMRPKSHHRLTLALLHTHVHFNLIIIVTIIILFVFVFDCIFNFCSHFFMKSPILYLFVFVSL